ncbi:unnamed protein product [Adineta steineri]|uniref:TIR domain-containing protein n=1 Tax=Adineta steineri TaxID=433720 RepID=A0A819MS41_9BILA|nr:unnamed protein product [Adineta steineri]CAF3985061.1 unnamed protein product [Adineta steineri]CAF4019295.1 unnamed protein product [Adineta steineri]
MSELSSGQEAFDKVTTEILILFWCMANRTILVPSLIVLDLPSSAVRWLTNSNCLNVEATEPLIRIIYNMARHDDGADEYNKLEAMEVIKKYQKRDDIAHNDKLSLCCSLAIAHLSTPEQLKHDQKDMNVVLNQLLQLTMEAATKEDFTCEGVLYHVSHLVAVLAKLFVVDERTVDYVMAHAETEPPSNMFSTFKLFADLLITFSNLITSTDPLNQFTCIAVYNIIWSISFQSEYEEELKRNIQLIDTVKKLAMDERSQMCDQYKPRALQSIKKAADEFEQTKDTLKVWIDIQQCAMGDLWERIADGIEHADVILCFISEYYHQSKSCRQELTYAIDDLQKPIIPILIGDYKPKGWLGIRKAGMKYIRFRNTNEPKHSEIADLMERVRAEISPGKNINTTLTAPLHHETHNELIRQKSPLQEIQSTIIDFPPIREWTRSDIHLWFNQHDIMEEIYDLFRFISGTEMLDYAQTLAEDRDRQQKTYSQIFTQKYRGQLLPPHEFSRFSKAMEQLLKENSTEHSIDTQLKQSTTSRSNKKSSTCIIL